MSREVAVVVGTRPELIKMAPVLRALSSSPLSAHVIHTGQHYDDALSGSFFETLGLSPPATNLDVGSAPNAEQIAAGLTGVAAALRDRSPAAAIALGDTNAVLSTAVAASTLADPVPFCHVEAGLRSFDRSMPEEVNRVVADHLADLLFAPTDDAIENLAAEGRTDAVRTGNTVVDACRQHAPIAARESAVLDRFDLDEEGFVVATVHRQRNTDDRDRLRAVVDALDDQPVPVVLPAHPRTATAMDAAGLDPDGSLTVCEPLGYLDFLRLLDTATVAVTDSGGVQEEAATLETPCLTVRPNTERPETVAAGVNELVTPSSLGDRLRTLLADDERDRMRGHPDLYGDGAAGERIVDRLVTALTDAGADDPTGGATDDRSGPGSAGGDVGGRDSGGSGGEGGG